MLNRLILNPIPMPNDVIIARKFRSIGPKTANRFSNVAFTGSSELNKLLQKEKLLLHKLLKIPKRKLQVQVGHPHSKNG